MEATKKVYQSLPLDLVEPIAERLLAGDVVDYISFRAVCREWRSQTASPQSLASCFRPRQWLMLTDGDANLHTADHRRFLNLCSGRSLLLRLPELDSLSLFTSSNGLLLLVDNSTLIVRIFNPFTRYLSDLPPLPISRSSILNVALSIKYFNISISGGDCPTVVLFSLYWGALYIAKPGDQRWKLILITYNPHSFLFFNERGYFTDNVNGIQILDPDLKSVKPLIPLDIQDVGALNSNYYLVEYNSEMYLIHKKTTGDMMPTEPTHYTFNIFRVNLEANRLILINNIGDLALLVGIRGQHLVLSSEHLPSIKGNSIYFLTEIFSNPIAAYDLDDRQIKCISTGTAVHDSEKRIRPSIRPFTLVDHLAEYGSPLIWA